MAGCTLQPGPPRLRLGQHWRSAPAAAAARPAVAAVSSDDWMTGSLSARAIPGSLKKQLTQKGSQSIQDDGLAVASAPQQTTAIKIPSGSERSAQLYQPSTFWVRYLLI